MHIPVRDYLRQLETDYPNDPLGFLWEFAPVHEWWHRERMSETQPVGFLTFHHLVIESFGRTFPGGSIPLEPSSIFTFPSVLANAARSVGDLAALREFSEDIEGWHNGAHNAVGGTFVNPLRNVFLRLFWQFHLFLNREFEAALGAMGLSFAQYFSTVAEADQREI